MTHADPAGEPDGRHLGRLSATGRVELLEPEYDAAHARSELRRGWIGVPIYGAATIVSLALPLLALVLYAAIAALYAITSQGWADARPAAARRSAPE
jgi:hypothetical protein